MDCNMGEEDQTRVKVCAVADLPPGSRTIVEVDGKEIGVFNVDGEFYALRNVCPHQLAPLCEGQLTGEVTAPAVGKYELTRQDEVVRCPWHGWQFDLKTGESVFNPHVRTNTYDVEVECVSEYGTGLAGEEPPVDTYDVTVEGETGREIVVLSV